MKDSTRKAIQYLTTPEGKALYRERRAYHFSEWSGRAIDWEPIYDRFFGDALIDVVESVAPMDETIDTGHLSNDLLDNFVYYKKDDTAGSEIPWLMGHVKKFDTMAKNFAGILDPYMA